MQQNSTKAMHQNGIFWNR